MDTTCVGLPAPHWAAPFVVYTLAPYDNLSNSVFGFGAADPALAYATACLERHAPTQAPDAFVPYVAGPSFITTAMVQYVARGHGGDPRAAGVRFLPQGPFFGPHTNASLALHSLDANWLDKKRGGV